MKGERKRERDHFLIGCQGDLVEAAAAAGVCALRGSRKSRLNVKIAGPRTIVSRRRPTRELGAEVPVPLVYSWFQWSTCGPLRGSSAFAYRPARTCCDRFRACDIDRDRALNLTLQLERSGNTAANFGEFKRRRSYGRA